MNHAGSRVTRYTGEAAQRLANFLAANVDTEIDSGMEGGPFTRLFRQFERQEFDQSPRIALHTIAPSAVDRQVGGDHYKGDLQPWHVIRAWSFGFFRGNILKYLQRAPKKNGKQDLEKARHYLEFVIENYDQLLKDGQL